MEPDELRGAINSFARAASRATLQARDTRGAIAQEDMTKSTVVKSSQCFTTSSGRTGFVEASGSDHAYVAGMDREMRAHVRLERPERLSAIVRRMQEEDLAGRCADVEAREASIRELGWAHTELHIQAMGRVAGLDSQADVDQVASEYESVYLTQGSFHCARLACGAVLELVWRVVRGELRNGLAAVRPPGHHAEAGGCCGFCVFNNVAVAAKAARMELGVERVLIVDWDVHHGNGTQHLFEDDPSVLYFSAHRYDSGDFFPGSKDAAPDKVGCGAGQGFNVNVAWNTAWKDDEGMGDDEYLAAWQCVLLPIAKTFQPQLVLISAGFDAARGDVGGCSITPRGYAQMTRMLQDVCSKIVLVLEGGYNINVTAECFVACARALLGEELSMQAEARPKSEARLSIERTLRAHRPFWSGLGGLCAGPVCLRGAAAPSGVTAPATVVRDVAAAKVSLARRPRKRDDRCPSGISIATRNVAESVFKGDVRKLVRKEMELRDALERIEAIKNVPTAVRRSRKDHALVADEEELRWQLKEVLSELKELRSLSKSDVIRMYSGAK